MTTQTARSLLVRLDGPRILDDAGDVIAELAPDGVWYTPAGMPCDGLTIPAPVPAARVDSATQRSIDDAWITETLAALRRVLADRQFVTSDDVWVIAEHPPREPRMIGNLFARAKSEGLMAATDRTQPSVRQINHGRPVRVWQSLLR